MNGTSGPMLLLATSNPGKRREFAALLPQSIPVVTLGEVPVTLPPETGETFRDNAVLKAQAAADASGLLALADDSGLEVEALGGAPGVYSARYAGEPPDEAANRRKLLAALVSLLAEQRTARFRCVVALAAPGRLLATAEGVCEGTIGTEERGSNGFGYDPLFVLPDGRTMAELAPEEKNRLSHRARAYRAILPELLAALNQEAGR